MGNEASSASSNGVAPNNNNNNNNNLCRSGNIKVQRTVSLLEQHASALLSQMQQRETEREERAFDHKCGIASVLKKLDEDTTRLRTFSRWTEWVHRRRVDRVASAALSEVGQWEERSVRANAHFVCLLLQNSNDLKLRFAFQRWMRRALDARARALDRAVEDAARLTEQVQQQGAEVERANVEREKVVIFSSSLSGKVQQLSNTVETLQSNGSLVRARELELENTTLKDQISRLEAALGKTQQQLQQSHHANVQLRESRDALAIEVEVLDRTRAHVSRLEQDQRVCEDDLRRVLEENDILRADIMALRDTVAELRTQLEVRAALPALMPALEMAAAPVAVDDEYVAMLKRAQERRRGGKMIVN
eukprot:PhM_4_TR4106/c0_g1_i1/m.14958